MLEVEQQIQEIDFLVRLSVSDFTPSKEKVWKSPRRGK